METKSLKIEIPKGYEIDKEKSTFENIVFKKVDDIVIKWNSEFGIHVYGSTIDANKSCNLTKMRKYLYYNVSTGKEVITTEDYQFAVRAYVKADSATLYGFTENGDCVIILSK